MISQLAKTYSTFRRQQRQMRALERLTDHQLADIGLMRSEVDGFVRRRITLG